MAFIGNTVTTQAFTPAVDFFSGNASTTSFTLSRSVTSAAQVQAVIENVPQNPGSAFTVSGNTITFTSAPPSGTNNIYVYYTSPITQTIAPSPGTMSTAVLDVASAGSGTGSMQPPAGTTAQRPAGVNGYLRYNSDLSSFEAYASSAWKQLAMGNVPGAPTIGTATMTTGTTASVTFTAPTNTGNLPISSYVVTSSPGGITATGTSSPITVSGLTQGTTYTFTVAAVNPIGTGASSAASNAVVWSYTVTYIVMGGGGGGGGGSGARGGGGGSGFVSNGTLSTGGGLTGTITIGGAGGGSSGTGSNGGNSTFVYNGVTYTGNGGNGANADGATGGSGGGGWSSPSTGGAGGSSGGGGGNGAGGPGVGAAGSGNSLASGAGGGGGNYSVGGGSGTYGSGGYGAASSGTGGAATGRGGGGGGGGGGGASGNSGTGGMVIISWPNTYPVATATTGSPTYANTGGNHVYTYTGAGTITTP